MIGGVVEMVLWRCTESAYTDICGAFSGAHVCLDVWFAMVVMCACCRLFIHMLSHRYCFCLYMSLGACCRCVHSVSGCLPLFSCLHALGASELLCRTWVDSHIVFRSACCSCFRFLMHACCLAVVVLPVCKWLFHMFLVCLLWIVPDFPVWLELIVICVSCLPAAGLFS